MKTDTANGGSPALICIDTTLLRFGNQLRGIPQVIFILLEIFSAPPFLGRVRFLAYRDVADKYLIPRGISPLDILLVPGLPLLGRWERFHGLFSTWRYRRATEGAALLLHPEARSMTRLAVPQIAILYDFLQIAGEWKPWRKPSRYLLTRYKYSLAMRNARKITISEHVKRMALQFFPKADPAGLTPLWLGVRESLKPARAPRTGALSLPLRCVYVGAFEERKNIPALIRHLDEIFGDLPFALDLVGKSSGEEERRVREAVAAAGHGERVSLRGLLSEEDLREVMENCDVTLFPSLGEGFGLPVAEGMTRGHVVFAFRNTSIPEVGGDAVVLAEDNDFGAWGLELKRLLGDPAACSALRRRAIERSALFSEGSMRRRFRDYFHEALVRAEAGRLGA